MLNTLLLLSNCSLTHLILALAVEGVLVCVWINCGCWDGRVLCDDVLRRRMRTCVLYISKRGGQKIFKGGNVPPERNLDILGYTGIRYSIIFSLHAIHR